MGPQYANRISDLLEDVSNGNQVIATEPEFIVEDVTKPRRDSKICAWVNVIYGCNERCKFCIVPSTRGVEQSRTAESILEEVRVRAGEARRGRKERSNELKRTRTLGNATYNGDSLRSSLSREGT